MPFCEQFLMNHFFPFNLKNLLPLQKTHYVMEMFHGCYRLFTESYMTVKNFNFYKSIDCCLHMHKLSHTGNFI